MYKSFHKSSQESPLVERENFFEQLLTSTTITKVLEDNLGLLGTTWGHVTRCFIMLITNFVKFAGLSS